MNHAARCLPRSYRPPLRGGWHSEDSIQGSFLRLELCQSRVIRWVCLIWLAIWSLILRQPASSIDVVGICVSSLWRQRGNTFKLYGPMLLVSLSQKKCKLANQRGSFFCLCFNSDGYQSSEIEISWRLPAVRPRRNKCAVGAWFSFCFPQTSTKTRQFWQNKWLIAGSAGPRAVIFPGFQDGFQLVDHCFNLLLMVALKMRKVLMLMIDYFFVETIHENCSLQPLRCSASESEVAEVHNST